MLGIDFDVQIFQAHYCLDISVPFIEIAKYIELDMNLIWQRKGFHDMTVKTKKMKVSDQHLGEEEGEKQYNIHN